MMFYPVLGILILSEAASLFLKGRYFVFRYLFIGAVIFIFVLAGHLSYQQYQIWSGNKLSVFLLPPYAPISYFLGYSFTHFFKNYLISLGAGILFLIGASWLNNKHQKRFFEEEEPYMGALAIFAAGHPFWMFYFLGIFSVGVVGTLYLKIIRSERRFPFYNFWFPVSIIFLLSLKFFNLL